VIVPTVALIALGAIPFYDRSHEGQGEWLSTPGAWRMVWLGSIVAVVGTTLLVLWDGAKHVKVYEDVFGEGSWPSALNWFKSARDFQFWLDNSSLSPIPEGLRRIPLGDALLRTDLLGLTEEPIDLTVNVPALIVEQIIPVTLMIGLPVLLSIVAWRIGWAKTRRDHMILQFSGFIATYFLLTALGTAFRGAGMELYWPWDVTIPIT
jgi:hypothetical protein